MCPFSQLSPFFCFLCYSFLVFCALISDPSKMKRTGFSSVSLFCGGAVVRTVTLQEEGSGVESSAVQGLFGVVCMFPLACVGSLWVL